MTDQTYLWIHGSHPGRTLDEQRAYVAHIVYGTPEVEVVLCGNGDFVALLTYSKEQATNADYTLGRMGSFPYGAGLALDKKVALTEFGSWIYFYAHRARIVAERTREASAT